MTKRLKRADERHLASEKRRCIFLVFLHSGFFRWGLRYGTHNAWMGVEFEPKEHTWAFYGHLGDLLWFTWGESTPVHRDWERAYTTDLFVRGSSKPHRRIYERTCRHDKPEVLKKDTLRANEVRPCTIIT